MLDDVWETMPDGTFASVTTDLQFTVQKLDQGARFLVFRRFQRGERASLLIASGVEKTPRDAMTKAISWSARFRLSDGLSEQAMDD